MATPMMTPGMATPSGMGGAPGQRLPPEVNRILYVRNLPFTISAEDMYKIFGDYGAIRQIRQCASPLSTAQRILYRMCTLPTASCTRCDGSNAAASLRAGMLLGFSVFS